ncbi:TPA: sigma-70 family RNA polymerase sigma factor [Candidatus Poribacteria bacterium]|nr:sigma-70 family RNA polymerase sigma factor [Candidatus Poribacteria bacterium]
MLEKTDLILVEQTQSGQLEAFGLLVKKYQQRVYNIAYRFTLNIDEANDLAQEIFLKAFRALPNFKSSSAFYTWLYRIAQNAGVDYMRRKRTRPEYLFPDEFPNDQQLSHPRVTDSQVVSTAEASEIQNQIKRAIVRLSPRQQQVFVLRYYQDLSLREIGEILGLRIGTVKAQLFNAIRKLRQLLADYVDA